MSETLYTFSNIIDFSECIQLKELHEKMGITDFPILPPIKFETEIERIVEYEQIIPEENEIDQTLHNDGFDLDFSDITRNSNQLLGYKGRKVVAYIREQGSAIINRETNTSNYKYHLCNCSTLKDMEANGRSRRFFITKRNDGFFKVHVKSEIIMVKMELCYNCVKDLRQSGLYFHNFNLKDYFKKHDSYIPKTIKKYETRKEIQDYSADHEEVARACRKRVNYTCQKCKLNCSESKNLLHLHHIDGDKSHNYPHNLQVLCVGCHSKMYKHEHMKTKFKSEIEIVRNMLKSQRILDLDS